MIEIRHVSKSYGRSAVKAVNDISVTAARGEIFGFLGPNGAGKTTSIKMITGVLRPDSGTIIVDGVNAAEEPLEAKRRIGYVTDNPELFSQLKAAEYLNFIGDVYGIDTQTRRERVERYTALFGIQDVLNGSIGSFSHGMKQKLLIAASLIHQPELWILDEPIVGLDPQSAFHLKTLMRSYADSGKTVFFSTHIMEIAEKVCDKLAIINKGQMLFCGSLPELQVL